MQNKRILVVEDEMITAMDIQSNLEKMNYQVVDVVLDGKRALKIAQKLNPDLILMDIVLKGELDGIEVADLISKKCNNIPIIFLTAYKDNKTFNRAKLCLPYNYLTKPFDPRDLQIAIELAIHQHDIQLKLAASESRNQLLMENAGCGIFLHDRFGVILDINKQGTIIFGNTKAAMIGQDFREYLPVSEQQYAQLQLNKLVIEKKIGPCEWHIIQPGGNIVDVQFSAVCMDLGKEEILMSILTDMTKQNKLREQTILNDKLVSMGTLTAGIIHEINNPLTWVLNNLSFLKEKLNNFNANINSIEDFNRAIDDALIGALSIHNITSSLKGFARTDETELVSVNINQLIDKIIHMLSAEIKYIKIERNFDKNIPVILTCESKLQHVLFNLLMNAIQSFKENDSEKNLIKITTLLKKNTIFFSIQDTGMGIPANKINEIFDPFFTTKPAGKGTGLGLAISNEIMNGLGSKIHVKSEVNKGTTFFMELPLQVTANNINNTTVKEKQNIKILIVDDEQLMLQSLKRVLDADYEVILALGGRDALQKLDAYLGKVNLIITDVYMLDINGIDLYRYIIEKYPGLEKNIIFLTGSISPGHQKYFFDPLKNTILHKPISAEQLNETIRSTLNIE